MTAPLLRGRPSGYSHPRCYANADRNCSHKISKEHFISDALLRHLEFADKVKIAGLAWQRPQEFDLIPRRGLASRVLCTRHNSAMSHLDSAVEYLCSTIRGFDQDNLSKPAVLSGSDIERWMLKCLMGLSASGNATGAMKAECTSILLGTNEWPSGWGLYFNTRASPIYHTDSLRIETPVSPQNVVMAARFFIQGFPFVLCLGRPDHDGSFGVWRPSKVEIDTKTLTLDWEDAPGSRIVSLNRQGSYSGHPPDWLDWQKTG